MDDATEHIERYRELFVHATGTNAPPYPYQERLATASPEQFPQLLDVPTGLGKTIAAVLAWLFRRLFCQNISVRKATPRRLVYCLPMRVLVEQTYAEMIRWLDRLGMLAGRLPAPGEHPAATPVVIDQHQALNRGALWDDPVECRGLRWYRPVPDTTEPPTCPLASLPGSPHRIAVHLLMGGEEPTDWALWPERDAILIGTQDMLLSRALNRGYAAGRARWPMEFGLLNNDCLWVFDEIQLMDTGLASSLQLDAWRRNLPLRPSRSEFPERTPNHAARPCHSLWMSATMARHWLERAVDFAVDDRVELAWEKQRLELGSHTFPDGTTENDRSAKLVEGLFGNAKRLVEQPVALTVPTGKDSKPDVATYLGRLSEAIAQDKSSDGLTLVIVNTVERATGIFRKLKESETDVAVFLIHSRFRPAERKQWSEFLDRSDDQPRIVVSTQVIEAGVDLSAKVLFTELAPWASLVQRFGRCARFVYPDADGNVRNERGTVYWMNLVDHERIAPPYDIEELSAARDRLRTLSDVGLKKLAEIKAEIDADETGQQAARLFPYEPRFVPRDKDLFDLFDTTPDLTGADIDIARFIRDGDELDVQVFWQNVPGAKPCKRLRPRREELCPVPFIRFREFLKKLSANRRVWRWNYVLGDWERVTRDRAEVVFPGQVFLLETACGGYDPTCGWTDDPSDTNFQPVRVALPDVDDQAPADEDDESDALSVVENWLNVEQHTRHVCRKLDELLGDGKQLAAGLTPSERKVLRVAARWHDRGKAHGAFKAKLNGDVLEKLSDDVCAKLGGEPIEMVAIAKAPDSAWLRRPIKASTEVVANDDSESDDEPGRPADKWRPKFRHEVASALAILETLRSVEPGHKALAWPAGLNPADFPSKPAGASVTSAAEPLDDSPLYNELTELSPEELDLLAYLVAAHHGKVRMSLRSVPEDSGTNQPDPCPSDKRRARGVQDDDQLPACRLPGSEDDTSWLAPKVMLHLDPMELGLSPRYGPSWRERTQKLLERLGPFRLAYLESLLRIADCRASAEEHAAAQEAAARGESK